MGTGPVHLRGFGNNAQVSPQSFQIPDMGETGQGHAGMAVVLQFWGNQVGTLEAVDDDGNGNTELTVGEMPFLPTDRVLVTFSNDSFDAEGEFNADGPITITEIRVMRDGQMYKLGVEPDTQVKESGGGTNKEQGDSFFMSNDSIGPSSSGPFSGIPEDKYVFVTGRTLTTDEPVVIPRVSGENGNGNFDLFNGLNNLICFAEGTRIATPDGEVPVEMLDVGDLVLTMDDGPQPIRWISRRRLPVVPARFWPVRIEAGAFGAGRPARALEVSPQHRIMLEGGMAELLFGEAQVLCPAKALVNDRSIRQRRPVGGLTYHHFCFDRHQIVLADGLECESFYPGPASLDGLEDGPRDELEALFPELGRGASRPPLEAARPMLRPYETGVLLSALAGLHHAEPTALVA